MNLIIKDIVRQELEVGLEIQNTYFTLSEKSPNMLKNSIFRILQKKYIDFSRQKLIN